MPGGRKVHRNKRFNSAAQRQHLILGLPPSGRPAGEDFRGIPTLILSADAALERVINSG
jgi:hypothetical protein